MGKDIYERPESPYCPVKTFELNLYTAKCSTVVLVAKTASDGNFSHSDQVWYCNHNVPLGINTLATFMSSISTEELKLYQKYVHH